MAFLSGTIDFREAGHVASLALACQDPSPYISFSAISVFALAEIGPRAMELASQSFEWAHEAQCFYKRLDRDLQQLMDDADEYQKFLELEPCLINDDSPLPYSEKSDLKFNDALILPSDLKDFLFAHMTLEHIAKFAQVSKCCHLATKADSIWEYKLNELYGGLKCLPKEQCSFSAEQQVKIIYKRTLWLLNNHRLNYQRNYELTLKFYNCSTPLSISHFEDLPDYYKFCWNRLRLLVGDNYRGTLGSIDPFSRQGRIIACIKQLKTDCQELSKPAPFKSYLAQVKKALEIRGRLKDFPERVEKMQELAEADLLTGMFITAKINARVWDYYSKIYLCAETFCRKMNEKLNRRVGFPGEESQSTQLLNQMLKHRVMPFSSTLTPAQLYQT